MVAPDNLSFEDEGTTAGDATSWVVSYVNQHSVVANMAFKTGTIAPTGFETFDYSVLVITLVSPTLALYGSIELTTANAYDSFEPITGGWDLDYTSTIVGESATFGVVQQTPGTGTESYAIGWNAVTALIEFGSDGQDITAVGHGFQVDDVVHFNGGSALPVELVFGTEYHVIEIASDTFKISATMSGSVITWTETAGDFTASTFGSDGVFNTTIQSSTVGDFDPGGGTDENFNAGSGLGWDTNYETSIGSSTLASFDSGGTPESVEDFEEVSFGVQFTVTVATDLINSTAHGLVVDDPVTFTSAGLLPAGLSPGVQYYIQVATTNSFAVKLEIAGGPIVITDTGIGVHTYFEDKSAYWTDEI